MPKNIEELEHKPRIITAKNQEKLMDIFNKFPEEEFTQHELYVQTQIKHSASTHSALMALVKKGKIVRNEISNENGARKRITYKKSVDT